jgi:predicted Zn-dependent protease with MMP-like domain
MVPAERVDSPLVQSQHPELERAWEAYDEGDLEGALALAARVPPQVGERWLLECLARTDQGELPEARLALQRAGEAGVAEDEPGSLWARGELLLGEWRIEEAERAFRELSRREDGPEVTERLAFCAELAGRFREADALYAKAHDQAPDAFPLVPRLRDAEFEEVVVEAIAGLPEEFRDLLEDSEVIVAPLPTPELAAARPPAETPPDLLGLFVGPSRLEWADSPGAEATPVVYLFQRNLERAATDHDELREQIAITLYHELGHLLGFDEEGVAELGLE